MKKYKIVIRVECEKEEFFNKQDVLDGWLNDDDFRGVVTKVEINKVRKGGRQ